MKLKNIIIILFFFTGMSSLLAQNKAFFEKLENEDKVTVVYISKAMLKFAPKIDTGKANIGGLISKLEQMEIYSSDDESLTKRMKVDINKYINNNTYEVLMKIKDEKDNINFLVSKNNGNKNQVREFIMTIFQEKECTIIRVLGTFTAEDIQKIVDTNSN